MKAKKKGRVKKERNKSFRGGRKAESISRMIERLKEKFPLDKYSEQWLYYARVLKTTAEVLEVQASNEMDPARLKGLKEAVQARAKAKAEAREEEDDHDNPDAEGG